MIGRQVPKTTMFLICSGLRDIGVHSVERKEAMHGG